MTLGKKLYLYTSTVLVLSLLLVLLVLERQQARIWKDYLLTRNVSFARFATPELLKIFRGNFFHKSGHEMTAVYDFLGYNRELIQFSIITSRGGHDFLSSRFPDFIDSSFDPRSAVIVGEEFEIHGAVGRTLRAVDGGQVLELTVPAFGPTGERLLSVRYWIAYDSVDARLAELRRQFLTIALVAVVGVLIVAAAVARRVTRPLKQLTDGVRAVGRDELMTRIAVGSRDEIGALATAFNDMAASLARSRAELTTKNEELLRGNQELRELQEQLVRSTRLAVIGQLAAGVSHEIDNPVGIILGHAELLLEELPPDDPQGDDLRAIIDECKRCKRITGGLLSFARSGSVRHEAVNFNQLIRETVASLQPQKIFKRITFSFMIDEDIPPIWGDADQLRQVLVNLLLNAAQAMDGEGRIDFSVRTDGESLLIDIDDTGPGISPAERERIFEPFVSTKPPGAGTGLGLSICRRLIDDHDGQINVLSAPTGGARFKLIFPLVADEKNFDNGSPDSLG